MAADWLRIRPPEGAPMTQPVAIERAGPADAGAVARLIEPAFVRFVAPALGDVGRVAFRMYVTESALRRRLLDGAVGFRATRGGTLAGYAELRGRDGRVDGLDHLTLLFVGLEHQRQGVARQLVETVREHLSAVVPAVDDLTVDASAYAVPAYQRLGFRPSAEASEFKGIVATPMRLVLNRAAASAAEPSPRPAASSARSA